MSTLNSSSTPAQIKAAFQDNASYMEDADPVKCAAFITACTFALQSPLVRAKQGRENEVELDPKIVHSLMETAIRWHSTSGAAAHAGGVLHPEFNGFRD